MLENFLVKLLMLRKTSSTAFVEEMVAELKEVTN
jgi:hypothetical protein